MKPLSIAVIGSGIAALSAAWLLSKHHRVTVFEKEARIGGHSNTVDVPTPDGSVPVDTGFIVFNPASYPNLVALFDHLDVETTETAMTFAASLNNGGYEYSGSGPRGVFGQISNLVSTNHWRMLCDIQRFFKQAELEAHDLRPDTSMADWLRQNNYSKAFIDNHLQPMAAAIWSTPAACVLELPAVSFMRFFANHGLLKVRNRPNWRTVASGSRQYIQKMLDDGKLEVRLSSAIKSIHRQQDSVIIHDILGKNHAFDHVVIGAHADEALAMLDDADELECNLLKPFTYSQNKTVLHTDPSQMPKRKPLWSSWNYIERADNTGENQLTVSYWMNRLQPLKTRTDLFVTLNPARQIDPAKALAQFTYSHPVFDASAMRAQRDLWELQGRRRTWFCGSYFGYGFHEDALQSGLAVAEDLAAISRPWQVEDADFRIHRKPVCSPVVLREAAE